MVAFIWRYERLRERERKISQNPHEKLLEITWVSKPPTRKDLAARTWGVFCY